MTTAEFTPRPLYNFDNIDCNWNQEACNHLRGRIGRAPSWQVGLSYPSPPMSGPPSPAVKSSQSSTDIEQSQDVTMLSIAPSAPSSDAQPSTSVAHEGQAFLFRSSPPQIPRAVFSGSQVPPGSGTVEAQSSAQAQAEASTAQHETPPSARGGRRSKTHVANACGNCKRAHLSCDVQRPCNRCVATGRAETCRDVPHKKRGRPRLREEATFGEPTAGSSSAPLGPGPSSATVRPERSVLPGHRHRRGDSLRSLRSIESSPTTVSTVSPTYGRPASRSWPQPRMMLPNQQFAVPIAYLDLDLVIHRANETFLQQFSGGQDLRGRRLPDIARSMEGDGFTAVRNQLREEREARDPAYLPPIFSRGDDPLAAVSDRDLDAVSSGFHDRQTYITFSLAGGGEQTLAARIRLARTSVYFVTITLPPVPQQTVYAESRHARTSSSSSIAMSPTSVGGFQYPFAPAYAESSIAGRSSVPQSAPPSPFYSSQGNFVGYGQHPSFASQQLPTAGSQHQYAMPQQVTAAPSRIPVQPVTHPSPMMRTGDPFTPSFAARRLSHPYTSVLADTPGTGGQHYHNQVQPQHTYQSTTTTMPSGPHLPRPAAVSTHSASSMVPSRSLPPQPPLQRPQILPPSAMLASQRQLPIEQQGPRPRRDTLGRQMSSDPEEGEEGPSQRSPRKRRRLDIGDVLQK